MGLNEVAASTLSRVSNEGQSETESEAGIRSNDTVLELEYLVHSAS